MRKIMLLWCLTMVLVFSINAQEVNTINLKQYDIVLEFSGKIENQLDSVFNIIVYLSDYELEEIEKISIKRIHINEDVAIEKILPKKERRKISSKSEKQKIILGSHSAGNPLLGIDIIDKKGRKINN